MGVFKTFGQGFRTARQKGRMLIYLWLFYFLFSLIVIAPFYFVFQKEFSRSVLGEKLFQGADFLWLGDLIYRYQNLSSILVGWLAVPAIIFLLFHIFLNGGIIGRIAAGNEKVTLQGFCGDGGKYYWRFFRVFLLSLVGYAVIFGIIGRAVSAPFRLWTKNASNQWTTLIASSLRLLIFLLLFSIVKMFFDYIKIRLVAEDSKKTLRAFLLNFSFLGRRFFKAWALFLLVGLVFVAVSVIYQMVAGWLPKPGQSFSGFFFLWQQLFILVKLWTTVLFFSTEYHFWMSHQPVKLEQKVPIPGTKEMVPGV
jgi:hypothetical protein